MVKAGLALVFKVRVVGPLTWPSGPESSPDPPRACVWNQLTFPQLAEASADKRQRIYDTFAALQDTLVQAHPERRSFRTNQSLNDCVDELYQSVVNAIHDIAVWLASEDKSRCKFP